MALIGGDDFEAELIGPERIITRVIDHGNGTYRIDLSKSPSEISTYTLTVSLGGGPIVGTPLNLVVAALQTKVPA